MLKVKLIDGSNRTVLVDDSALAGEILAVVCQKVHLNNPDEYGLRLEGKKDGTLRMLLPNSVQLPCVCSYSSALSHHQCENRRQTRNISDFSPLTTFRRWS